LSETPKAEVPGAAAEVAPEAKMTARKMTNNS